MSKYTELGLLVLTLLVALLMAVSTVKTHGSILGTTSTLLWGIILGIRIVDCLDRFLKS